MSPFIAAKELDARALWQPPSSSNADLIRKKPFAASVLVDECPFRKPKNNVCGSNHTRPRLPTGPSAAN